MWYWCKVKNVDQWNGIAELRDQKETRIYSQLIFNKGANTIQWGKNLSTNSAEIIEYPYVKKEKEIKELRILPHIYKN